MFMKGVTISDRDPHRDVLSFDLKDLASILPFFTDEFEWEVANAESVGPAAEELHQVSDTGVRLGGRHLADLASRVTQVIDGEFKCFRTGTNDVEAIVRAVDSSAYDILCDRHEVLEDLRRRFKEVVDLRC